MLSFAISNIQYTSFLLNLISFQDQHLKTDSTWQYSHVQQKENTAPFPEQQPVQYSLRLFFSRLKHYLYLG